MEAAHILFVAAPDDEERRKKKVVTGCLIDILSKTPERFSELARAHSACE